MPRARRVPPCFPTPQGLTGSARSRRDIRKPHGRRSAVNPPLALRPTPRLGAGEHPDPPRRTPTGVRRRSRHPRRQAASARGCAARSTPAREARSSRSPRGCGRGPRASASPKTGSWCADPVPQRAQRVQRLVGLPARQGRAVVGKRAAERRPPERLLVVGLGAGPFDAAAGAPSSATQNPNASVATTRAGVASWPARCAVILASAIRSRAPRSSPVAGLSYQGYRPDSCGNTR